MSIVVIPHQPISFDYRLDNCSNLSDQCVHFELSDTAMFQVTNSADGCGVLVFIRATGDTVFDTISIPYDSISVSSTFVTVTLDFTSLGLSEGCYEVVLYNVCTNTLTNLITNGTFTGNDNGWTSVNPMVISVVSFDNESAMAASDGTVTFSVSGGTGPYLWSLDGITFQSSSTFTGLTAGNYTVTVKDVNLLISTDSYTVYTNVDCSLYNGLTLQQVIDTGSLLVELYNCTLDDLKP